MRQGQGIQIVALLQREPMYYRNFGIFWWFIKRELKRLGFTKDNLPHLGDFEDPRCEQYYRGRSAKELEETALVFQVEHAQHKYNSDHSFIPYDNEVYIIKDEDVE
tara:strand:- start:531 stop:848 length:318 start_codon:yes stop_codon:yes gene_type:complete